MKCPLFVMAGLINYKRVTQGDMDCIQGECAWWDEEFNHCALRTLARQVTFIDDRLNSISQKMPAELALKR